ncbi:MAG: glutathione S-transferase family protein [Myxococcota bacterium]
MSTIELFQFAGSHFNEKARWGLDWKGVPHERISLMPGPHMRTVKKLTGATQTPVLRDDGRVIAGSTAILEHLEARFPEPPLIPSDAPLRERALAIVRRFDDEVGPAIRLAKFFEVMEADYAVGTFCHDQGALARGVYRAAFPVIGRIMRSSMGIDAENAARARETTREAFDFVAKEPGPSGHLVGDTFTIADLTCAALLMPAVAVSEWGGPVDADTEKNRAWLARRADHPGTEWVRETYRRHRVPMPR